MQCLLGLQEKTGESQSTVRSVLLNRVSDAAEMKMEMPQVEVRLQERGRDHRPISFLSAAVYATTDDSSSLPTHRVEENRAYCKKQREIDSFFKRENGMELPSRPQSSSMATG